MFWNILQVYIKITKKYCYHIKKNHFLGIQLKEKTTARIIASFCYYYNQSLNDSFIQTSFETTYFFITQETKSWSAIYKHP